MRFVKRSLPVLLAVLFASVCLAAIPQVINYQGRLLDSGGSPVADGSHQVSFELFNVSAGGASLWSSGTRTIETADGLFDYPLGDSVAFPGGLFANNPDLYLEITIVGDPPLSPRTKLASVPYTFYAQIAEDVAYEPGVTQAINSSSVNLANGFQVELIRDSILAPTNGVVLCQVTFSASTLHIAGDTAAAAFFIVDSTGALNIPQENYFIIDDGYGSGTFEVPIHIHRIFEVVPGWNDFSVIGADFVSPGQTMAARRITFTMTFFDRAYSFLEFSAPPTASTDADDRIIGPVDESLRQQWIKDVQRSHR